MQIFVAVCFVRGSFVRKVMGAEGAGGGGCGGPQVADYVRMALSNKRKVGARARAHGDTRSAILRVSWRNCISF